MYDGLRDLKNTYEARSTPNKNRNLAAIQNRLEFEGGHREEMSAMSKGTNRIGVVEGEIEKGIIQVGQSLVPLDKVESVSEIVESLMKEARYTLDSASKINI